MRSFILVMLMFTLVATFVNAKGYEVRGKAGSYTMDVEFDKNPPAKGDNRIEIDVADAALNPVKGATVVVNYLMPSLPGRPPMMEYKTVAESKDKKYNAIVDLSMAGEWVFVVNIARDGKTEAMKFTLVVR
jgi:hypothetical protein